ncbi:hypothetical protein PMAYCL1PPCAC_25756, partial [Pristionchus mayeri]
VMRPWCQLVLLSILALACVCKASPKHVTPQEMRNCFWNPTTCSSWFPPGLKYALQYDSRSKTNRLLREIQDDSNENERAYGRKRKQSGIVAEEIKEYD